MSSNPPAVDVVVLSWNRLQHTLACVQSVERQRGAAPRLWIVDQGSEPGQLDALKQATEGQDWIHVEELGTNVGVPAGRNLGMSLGQAPHIAVLDNDAVLADPDALTKVAERFESGPDLGAIGFQIRSAQTDEVERLTWGYPRSLWDRRAESFLTTRFIGAGHALRRQALARTHGYDEKLFFVWEELDLSYQLIAAGYHIRYDPAIVVLHEAAPEQRHYWGGRRFYFHVRNGLYVRYKHLRSISNLLAYGLGYLMKGAYNALPGQALRGVRDALRMIRELPQEGAGLGPQARRYLQRHDEAHRGGMWQRVRDEVFERLED